MMKMRTLERRKQDGLAKGCIHTIAFPKGTRSGDTGDAQAVGKDPEAEEVNEERCWRWRLGMLVIVSV